DPVWVVGIYNDADYDALLVALGDDWLVIPQLPVIRLLPLGLTVRVLDPARCAPGVTAACPAPRPAASLRLPVRPSTPRRAAASPPEGPGAPELRPFRVRQASRCGARVLRRRACGRPPACSETAKA